MASQKFMVVITLAMLIFLHDYTGVLNSFQDYTGTSNIVVDDPFIEDPDIYPDPTVGYKSLYPPNNMLPPKPEEPLPESEAPSSYGACARTIPMGNADQNCDDNECGDTCGNSGFSRQRSFCIEDFLCCCMPLVTN